MEFIEGVSVVARWLFITSLKAAIVIALIMIIRFIFRNRLPAKWQHALWFLLILRLALPVDISSPVSVFNLTKKIPVSSFRSDRPDGFRPEGIFYGDNLPTSQDADKNSTQIKNEDAEESAAAQPIITDRVMFSLVLVWLLGVFAFFMYALRANVRVWFRLRRAKEVPEVRLYTILAACRRKQIGHYQKRKNLRLRTSQDATFLRRVKSAYRHSAAPDR